MAFPTNTFVTYTAVGQREHLSDMIYDISPTETPFVSNLPREKATAIQHEWQMDNLATANTANAAVEGDDHSGAAIAPTQRLGNICQIFRKDIVVSGTMRAVETAGRADELDYQVVKTGKEVKRDIEAVMTGDHIASAGGATTARNLAGSETWLGSLSVNGISYAYHSVGTGTSQTTAGFVSTTGLCTTVLVDSTVQGALTKLAVDNVIREAWINGGSPTTIMTGPFNKQAASGFTGIATLQKDAPGTKQAVIVGAADVYVSDFGVHTVVPNRFNRDRTVQILDMALWANAELRPFMTVPVAKTGDSDKMMLLTETTLMCRNPFGSGKVADCTTS